MKNWSKHLVARALNIILGFSLALAVKLNYDDAASAEFNTIIALSLLVAVVFSFGTFEKIIVMVNGKAASLHKVKRAIFFLHLIVISVGFLSVSVIYFADFVIFTSFLVTTPYLIARPLTALALAEEKISSFLAYQIFTISLPNFITLVILFVYRPGFSDLLNLFIICSCLTALITAFCFSLPNWTLLKKDLNLSVSAWKKLVQQSAFVYMNSILAYLIWQGDMLIIISSQDPALIAAYGILARVINMFGLLKEVIINSQISKIYGSLRDNNFDVIRSTTKNLGSYYVFPYLVLLFSSIAFISLFGNFLFTQINFPEWSTILFSLLLLSHFGFALFGPVDHYLIALNKEKHLVIASLISLTIVFLSQFIFFMAGLWYFVIVVVLAKNFVYLLALWRLKKDGYGVGLFGRI